MIEYGGKAKPTEVLTLAQDAFIQGVNLPVDVASLKQQERCINSTYASTKSRPCLRKQHTTFPTRTTLLFTTCLFVHHKLRIPFCSQGLKELGKALQKGDIPAMMDLFVSVRNAMHVHKRQGEKVVYPTLDHMNAQVRNDTDSRSV